jgi:O-antigen/teichoic acid export membrane protein
VKRLKDIVGLLSLTPGETATAAGRSRERLRRVAVTVAASAISRVVSALTLFASVPLALGYLGEERYGLWMTLSSIIAMLSLADLGLGYGVLNRIAEASGRDDTEAARVVVSSGICSLLVVAGVLGAAFALAYPWLSWRRIFNVQTHAALREAGPATAVFVVCFLVGLPLGVVQRVREGYQEGFANGLWNAVGAVLGLGGMLVAIRVRAPLPWLVLSVAGAPVVATLVNGVLLFRGSRSWLRPRLQLASWSTIRSLIGLGLLFFILQGAAAVAFGADNVIVAQVLGPPAVTQYAVPARLFTIPTLLLQMALTPLWPAYGEAFSRGDRAWLRRTVVVSLVGTVVVATLMSGALCLTARPLLRLWVGNDLGSPTALLVGLAIWTVLNASGHSLAMFLNGVGALRLQAACALAMTAVVLVLKVLLARSWGLSGVVWGNIAGFTILDTVPMAVFVPWLLTRDRLARATAA